MRIINPRVFDEARRRFPQKAGAIDAMRKTLTSLRPRNSAELKTVIRSLERFPGRPNCYRLDVGGRKGLRMIAVIQITHQTVYVHLLGSHDEYEKFSF